MPVFMMYSTILTELGIVVLDNQKCVKTFHFENPAEEYVLVKKGQAKPVSYTHLRAHET